MEIAVVGSGSKGNCSLIRSGSNILMVDCGFSLKETEQRLLQLGLNGSDISALLITHEHSDHIGGVKRFATKFNTPLYMTHGTKQYFDKREIDLSGQLTEISLEQVFSLEDIKVTPVPVPHDAKEPCQYVFEGHGIKLGLLSDIGHISQTVRKAYSDCDALFIECNHDREMLADGPYPQKLKGRVRGDWGHLSNCQTVEFLARIQTGLRHLLIGHISETNNSQDSVKAALAALTDLSCAPVLAPQHDVQQWVSLV